MQQKTPFCSEKSRNYSLVSILLCWPMSLHPLAFLGLRYYKMLESRHINVVPLKLTSRIKKSKRPHISIVFPFITSYVNNYRQPALMIIWFSRCLFMLLPWTIHVSFQIKYDYWGLLIFYETSPNNWTRRLHVSRRTRVWRNGSHSWDVVQAEFTSCV